MHIIHFKPVPYNLTNSLSISASLMTQLNKILQFIHKCYDNRMYSSIEVVNEAEFYLSELNKLILDCKDKNDLLILEELYTYFSDLINVLHIEYDIQDRSIISFLVYYLKTPLLLLDDPNLIYTTPLIKGLNPLFISSFLQLTPEDRLEFIISLTELGINFNDWFSKSKAVPLLNFNMVDYCNKFYTTLIKNYSKSNPKLESIIEKEICSDFSRYYDENNEKTFQIIVNLLHTKYEFNGNCEKFANNIINDMTYGKHDTIINIRLNQFKLLQPLYNEERYVECSDNIEDSTLNSIHERIIMQKAILSNPFDYIVSSRVKGLKKMLKKKQQNDTNLLDSNISFLEHEIKNYLTQLQSIYKKYKNDIHKCLQYYHTHFTSSKQYKLDEIIHVLEEYCYKINLNLNCIQFFILFYKCFNGNLSFLPKNYTSKHNIYHEYTSDIQNIVNEKNDHYKEYNSIFELDEKFNYNTLQPHFSIIHYEIKKEYPDYDIIENHLKSLQFNQESIEKGIQLLEVGKLSSFISLFHDTLATLKYNKKKDKHPFKESVSISTFDNNQSDNQNNNQSDTFWILLKPILNIPSDYKFCISYKNKNEYKKHPYFNKSIKEIPNFFIPSNLFWNDSSNKIISDDFDFIIGVYDVKNPIETFREFTEDDYNKVKEYIKKSETKIQHFKSKLLNDCITSFQIQQCKTLFTNMLRLFYKKNNSKRNPNKDAHYFIHSLQTMLNYNYNSICYPLDVFLKKCTLIHSLLDINSPIYNYSKSFQSLWLNAEHNMYPKILQYNLNQYFPELFLTKNSKESTDIFYKLVKETEDLYSTHFINENENTNFLSTDFNSFMDIQELFKNNMYYMVHDNGSISCFNKNEVYKCIRGEIKVKGIHDINDLLKNFIPYNSNDIMSYLAYIQCTVDSIIQLKNQNCISFALHIISYIKGTITFDKCNTDDKLFISNLLPSIQTKIFLDIAIHYLVMSVLEKYRESVIHIVQNYLYQNPNFLDECKSFSKNLLEIYDNNNTLAQEDTNECYNLYSSIFNTIQSNLNITLSKHSKHSIIYYIHSLLQLPHLFTNNTFIIDNNKCSICNENNNIPLKTVTIHKHKNTLLDKIENFCSIECMDVHLASAPSPNEQEMKQLEIRSLIRDTLRSTFHNLETLQNIAIDLKFLKYASFLKKHFNNKKNNILNILYTLSKDDLIKVHAFYKLLNTQIDPYNTSFSKLLKQCLLLKDEDDNYCFTSIFLLPIYSNSNTKKCIQSSISSFIDYISEENINTYNPHLNLYQTFILKAIDYFKPNITITNLSLQQTYKIIYSSLFNNPTFLEMFFSVVDEISPYYNNSSNSNSSNNNECNVINSECNSKISSYCPHISTNNVKQWITKKINTEISLNKNIDYFDTIIFKPFERKFNCNLPTVEECKEYENIISAVHTLNAFCIFLISTNKYKHTDFITWLTNYYSDSLKKALSIKYKNIEKHTSIFTKCMDDYDAKDDIANLCKILRKYSSILSTNEFTSDESILKLFYSLYNQHISEKITSYELYNIIYNYCNCNWNSTIDHIKNGITIYKKSLDFFIDSYLDLITNNTIQNTTQDEIIDEIETEYKDKDKDKDEDEDKDEDKNKDKDAGKDEDENINQWIENLSQDIIVTDSIDKWVDNLEQINTNDIITIEDNQKDKHKKSESESESESDSEDEIQTLQKQFKTQFEQEKHINPIVKHTYNKLIHSSSNEELVDIIDSILPENEKEIDESFINIILSDLEMIRKNSKNNNNRIAIYNQIAKLMNKPLYI